MMTTTTAGPVHPIGADLHRTRKQLKLGQMTHTLPERLMLRERGSLNGETRTSATSVTVERSVADRSAGVTAGWQFWQAPGTGSWVAGLARQVFLLLLD